MIPKTTCLRCGGTVRFLSKEKLQLGKYVLILGHLSNVLAGALAVDLYACENCGKCEFYIAETEETATEEPQIAQITCPVCGHRYDIDYPKCPCCQTETQF